MGHGRILATTLALALVACGGGSGGNPAASKTFNYGTPSQMAAGGTEASAVDSQIGSVLALRTTGPDADGAQGIAEFSGLMQALLGEGTFMFAAPDASLQHRAVARATAAVTRELATTEDGGFENVGCVTETQNKVELNNCYISMNDADSSGKVTVDGFLEVIPPGTVKWRLDMSISMAGDGFNVSANYATEAEVIASTTIDGHMGAVLSGSASGNGQSMSLRVGEMLTLAGIAYDESLHCVTSGTLEAKRVWEERPEGYSAAELPDKGAKVVWTGCGTGTIAFSTN